MCESLGVEKEVEDRCNHNHKKKKKKIFELPAESGKILYGCCLSPNFWLTFSTTPLPPAPSPFIKAFYARDPPNSMLVSQAVYCLKTASHGSFLAE